jgi:hypothetical protein
MALKSMISASHRHGNLEKVVCPYLLQISTPSIEKATPQHPSNFVSLEFHRHFKLKITLERKTIPNCFVIVVERHEISIRMFV